MKKMVTLFFILFCSLFANIASAGGTGYIPHWEQNSSWSYWIYLSNIGSEDLNVKLSFRDSSGTIVSPINMTCIPSCSANQYFTISGNGSTRINIPAASVLTYGYVSVQYDIVDQQGNVIDGISRLVAQVHRQSLSSTLMYTVPVNGGMPF